MTDTNKTRLKQWLPLILLTLVSLPWVLMRIAGIHSNHFTETILAGIAIFTAAFILSWAAEVAQIEIAPSLAISVLALIAVFPEYAVDMIFAWKAGKDPAYAHYAVANMTGSNRIIIGLAWPMVILLYWWTTKKKRICLDSGQIPSVAILLIAALYSFIIPIKKSITIFDGAILFCLFLYFVYLLTRGKIEEPELEGLPATISLLPRFWRRIVNLALFVYAGVAIFISAEPFAEGLIHIGKSTGIDEFFLVQWIAPIASEAPEFIVAAIFAFKRNINSSLGTLVSSKVNQWTLLVGFIPLVYSVSAGKIQPLMLDPKQVAEMLLTSAQTLLAVAILADRRVNLPEAFLLFGLFAIQFFIKDPHTREIFSTLYIIWAVVIFISQWRAGGYRWIKALFRLRKRRQDIEEIEAKCDEY